MATNLSRKIDVFRGTIFTLALPFRNELQYRNSDFKMSNGMNFSALCRILVRFGSKPKIYVAKNTTFAAIWQNRHITPNISEYPAPIFSLFTGLVGLWVG